MNPSPHHRRVCVGLALAVALAIPATSALARGKPDTAGARGHERAAAAHQKTHGHAGNAGAHAQSRGAAKHAAVQAAEPVVVAQVQPVGVVGNKLNVKAKVKVHGPKDPAMLVSATAQLGAGELVPLVRMGRSLVFRAFVPVPADAVPGASNVHVEVTVGDPAAGALAQPFDLPVTLVAGDDEDEAQAPEVDEPGTPEVEQPEQPEAPDVDEPEAPEAEAPVATSMALVQPM